MVSQLLGRLDGYIEFNHNRVSGFETGLRCRPVPGVFPDNDDFTDEDFGVQKLLEYDSGGDADDEDVLEGLQPMIVDWKPSSGDINIVPRMYANEISKLTGTDLFAKPTEKKYSLLNGDVQLALQKLSNMEPLLVRHTQPIQKKSID